MTRLGAVISEAIIHHYGRDELLRRLAHPFCASTSAFAKVVIAAMRDADVAP